MRRLTRSCAIRLLPDNRMKGAANVLIFAHADAASGVRNILKMKAGGLEVGPILMGMGNRAHIVTRDHRARPAEHGRDRRHAGGALRLTARLPPRGGGGICICR